MDSNNILSILAALQGSPAQALSGQMPPDVPVTYQPVPEAPAAPISNVLQAAAPPPPPPPVPVAAPAPTAAPAEQPRKKRQSVIDTIGRLADVFAKVGGADALYEPSLEHREDRFNKVDMDALQKRLTVAQVGEAELEPVLAERKRIGTALGALAGRENAAELWPSIAAQAGIDPQKAAALGQILQANPDAAGIFARSLGADLDNLGKNVYFGTGPKGETLAYQVGEDGQPHILDFGGKLAPSDPIKVVNTGGATVVLDSHGNPRKVLPNTVSPNTSANNRTAITIAGMPARTAAGGAKAGDNAAFVQTATGNLNELRQIYQDLHKMGAMVSPAQSKDKNVVARIRASGIGQTLEGAVGTQAQTKRDRIASIRPGLMQSLAKATGMTGKQLDSNADVKLFMQTVTDPTKSYEANMEAIAGLERFLKANTKKPAAAAPVARPKAQSGWSIVKVK